LLTQAPIIKTTFLKENQLQFDGSLKRGQEFDFFINLLFVEKDYCFTNAPLVYLRKHNERISNTETFSVPKTKSIFNVSYRALNKYGKILKPQSINSLYKRQLIQIIYCIDKKEYKTAKELYFLIIKNYGLSLNIFKLTLGFYSYKHLGKGKFFL
jgi:hypothetical protein